jgi:hypothetical protein
VRTEVTEGSAAEEIIRIAEEMNTDMVAMSTHGLSGVGHWTLGSVAEKVLYAGNTPILLVRALEKPGYEIPDKGKSTVNNRLEILEPPKNWYK